MLAKKSAVVERTERLHGIEGADTGGGSGPDDHRVVLDSKEVGRAMKAGYVVNLDYGPDTRICAGAPASVVLCADTKANEGRGCRWLD